MENKRPVHRLRRTFAQSNVTFYVLFAISLLLVKSIYSSLNSPLPRGIANVPSQHADGKVHIHDMNVLTSTSDPIGKKEKVLILTPLAKFLEPWWDNLVKINYPHDLIDLGVIVPDNEAGDLVLSKLNSAIHKLQNSENKFRKITVLRQDTPSLSSQEEAARHAMEVQKERRRDMSLARNSLVFTSLQSDTSWVFWLDGDIVETPPTIIQDMAHHNKDVLVANCWQRFTEDGQQKTRPYDFNSWVDTDSSRKMAAGLADDEIMLEGYAEMATYRLLMAHLYDQGKSETTEMELDGVGATALLVRADVHRDGAIFPPFSFYHLIESEGFAKMAKRLGYKVWGLPNYLVYHYNE